MNVNTFEKLPIFRPAKNYENSPRNFTTARLTKNWMRFATICIVSVWYCQMIKQRETRNSNSSGC